MTKKKDRFLKTLIVTVQVPGSHFWRECPLREVSYLKHTHRHLFKIVAYIGVAYSREREFFWCQNRILEFIHGNWGVNHGVVCFGEDSCEQIAEHIADGMGLNRCEVWEDGENGAAAVRMPA